MKTIIQRIKRGIGRCECKRCWELAIADIYSNDQEIQICMEHLFKILEQPESAGQVAVSNG